MPVDQQCTWCRKTDLPVTGDHVFPRSIGGTKQLTVPACKPCQTFLSKAEAVLARRSIFGLYTLDGGPPPRHKKKPESGTFNSSYSLVKDSKIGGYAEVVFRVGKLPKTLPSIEIDVVSGRGARVHGTTPQEVDQLVERLIASVQKVPDETGCIGEISCDFVEEDSEIASDADFWPRALLDIRGNLKIRACNPEEGKRLAQIIIPLAQQGAFSDHSQWMKGQIPAGTPHHVSFSYYEPDVLRIIAKIAYGVLRAKVGPILSAENWFNGVRSFVRGEDGTDENPPVLPLSDPGDFKGWHEVHLALIDIHEGELRGVIMLYGGCHLVRFGRAPEISSQIEVVLAASRRDGSDTRFIKGEAATEIAEEIKNYVRMLERAK